MTNAIHQNTTLRVGVFSTPHQADKVVEGLLAAGFTTEQITVICSDAARQRHFHQFEHQARGASVAPGAVAAGGAIGALVGGLAAVTAALATGGVALLFTGGAAAWAGAVVGGLVGAMMTRGFCANWPTFTRRLFRRARFSWRRKITRLGRTRI